MADPVPLRPHDDDARTTADRVKDGAGHALASARQRATDAARVASEEIDSNPLAIVAGGVALGVLIGAALPRTAREDDLLRPLGQRLVATARSATDAARETGREQLASAGLSRDNARGQADRLIENLIQAFAAAIQAGARSARATAADPSASR